MMAELEAMNATATTRDSDSDYEYEHTDETEDFYFTLDVTKHQSQVIPKPNQSIQSRTPKGKQSAQTTRTDSLQVLDLHTENPLVKLSGSFYSCHWSTDFGTQFYVTKPGVVEEPLRRGYVLDVLGISRARLTGTPVTLHRRRPDASEKPAGSSTGNAIVLDIDDDEQASAGASPVSTPTSQQPPMTKNIARLATTRQNARDPLVRAQASFLERLAIIKRQKGETDVVPVHGVEDLTGPRQDAGNTATTNTSDGKRKSVSNDVPNRSENGEPSRKRHVSEARIAQDSDGDFPSTYPQPINWNAEVSFLQDKTVGNAAEGDSASVINTFNDERAVNTDHEITKGQKPGQSSTEQVEGQP